MSNLRPTGKITDPHLSAEEPLTFRRCLRFILRDKPCCWPSAAQPSSELSEFYLFSFSKYPCRIRAILYESSRRLTGSQALRIQKRAFSPYLHER